MPWSVARSPHLILPAINDTMPIPALSWDEQALSLGLGSRHQPARGSSSVDRLRLVTSLNVSRGGVGQSMAYAYSTRANSLLWYVR